jgi:mevalonate kinase
MIEKKDEVLPPKSFGESEEERKANAAVLSVLFKTPSKAFGLRELWKEAKNLNRKLGGTRRAIVALEKAGYVTVEKTSDRRSAKWKVKITHEGFNEFREFYVETRKKGEDGKFIKELVERGAEWIVSSPRAITLLGEYAIADSTADSTAKALGMAINSRTYIGFARTESPNGYKKGSLRYFRNNQWSPESWKDTGLKNLEEYYHIVREWWNKRNPEVINDQTANPSIIVRTDAPGNIGLHLSASTMPAFVTGLLLFFQSGNRLEKSSISTRCGELSLTEKQLIQKIAVECEKLYRKQTNAKLCSGVHSLTSTYGGIIYIENKRSKIAGENRLAAIWTDDLNPTELKFPIEQFPIAIVEPAEHEENATATAIAEVLKCKNRLAEIDKENIIFESVYRIMNYITDLGRKYLEDFSPRDLGILMAIQHQLMRTIGASHPSVEELLRRIDNLKTEGILGTKITGAGGKGSSILILYDPTYFGKKLNKELFRKLRSVKSVLAERILPEKGVSIEIPPKYHETVKTGPIVSSQDKARLMHHGRRS